MTKTMNNQADANEDAPARVAEILDAIAELAQAHGWRREDVAVAMARGAGELVWYISGSSADLDRAVGALTECLYTAASGHFERGRTDA